MANLVTLTTDFGDSQGCVGIMKGVMACINLNVKFIDMAHDIPSHDVFHAAFVLKTAYRYFPEGTVHLAVVDPGVGGSRRPIAVRTDRYYFVGPDNGLFTYIYGENEFDAREITEAKYTLGVDSTTFDGRDIFAPVAAYLSLGVSIEQFGQEMSDPVRLDIYRPEYGKGLIKGHVIHIDQFGNLITDIERDESEQVMDFRDVRIRAGDLVIETVSGAYSDGPPGEPVCVWGSHGHLEVAVSQGRAVDSMEGMDRGAEVFVQANE
ncbi:hypothetical protein E3J38_07110 [candidate division TA06 bacterium]|uniref:SAM-dependent chlorinase/fluorinase n=1 Tax=candidate division TA06 bacterium TaxID=2250710 RepID=A0A523XJR6_UNCT6|nr:MAG: hypothetical protein E3J38_07110 [candidate division TA06 bacterium]